MENLRRKIETSGLKKKYIAKCLGVHQSVISMVLSGDRILPPDKEVKLKQLLTKCD